MEIKLIVQSMKIRMKQVVQCVKIIQHLLNLIIQIIIVIQMWHKIVHLSHQMN